jgi:hypothetical protein
VETCWLHSGHAISVMGAIIDSLGRPATSRAPDPERHELDLVGALVARHGRENLRRPAFVAPPSSQGPLVTLDELDEGRALLGCCRYALLGCHRYMPLAGGVGAGGSIGLWQK